MQPEAFGGRLLRVLQRAAVLKIGGDARGAEGMAADLCRHAGVPDAPAEDTLQGLRGRAILSVGLQVGPRRAEIAGLKVKDFHMNAGYPALHFIRKGGEDHSLAIHPQAAERIRVYLEAAGHADATTTKLYDRRGYNPEKSASFFASY